MIVLFPVYFCYPFDSPSLLVTNAMFPDVRWAGKRDQTREIRRNLSSCFTIKPSCNIVARVLRKVTPKSLALNHESSREGDDHFLSFCPVFGHRPVDSKCLSDRLSWCSITLIIKHKKRLSFRKRKCRNSTARQGIRTSECWMHFVQMSVLRWNNGAAINQKGPHLFFSSKTWVKNTWARNLSGQADDFVTIHR